MCGICGKLSLTRRDGEDHRDAVVTMAGSMIHRGPDEEGFYSSPQVALGHRRLKIIDLTTGQQPMRNEDGSVWIIFNGEIYNFKQLRAELLQKGHQFRTASDTEVIVHLYEDYKERCVEKLWGMFTFAIWDAKERSLLLARDRLGIKPLYYALTKDRLVFGSEIKSLLADPEVAAEAQPEIIDRFLTYFYVPGEETLFKGISKLSPGHYLLAKDGKVKVERYWDLVFSSPSSVKKDQEYAAELEELLRETVRGHMISDVPVGVLLSGGVDSTAMLSFAVEQTDQPVSTFTIGFDHPGCVDERPYARMAAEKFGTRHYEATISAADFLAFLPKYVWHMEEPVCEPPAVALYYISKLAREHVTVLISGEGGDEVFAGYQNYRNLLWLEAIKRSLGPLATPFSKLAVGVGRHYGLPRVERYGSLMTLPLDQYYFSRSSDPRAFFNRNKNSLYTSEFQAEIGSRQSILPSLACFAEASYAGDLNRMLYVDTKTWLPDDLLIKADKITMANSLELRVPLLDHRVLEFGAALPANLKVNRFNTKYLLKRTLARRVPAAILNRPKTGFPVPYASWLKNELKGVAESILLDSRTVARGYFSRSAVEELLRSNAATGSYSKEVFSLITLELWHRIFLEGQDVRLN